MNNWQRVVVFSVVVLVVGGLVYTNRPTEAFAALVMAMLPSLFTVAKKPE